MSLLLYCPRCSEESRLADDMIFPGMELACGCGVRFRVEFTPLNDPDEDTISPKKEIAR